MAELTCDDFLMLEVEDTDDANCCAACCFQRSPNHTCTEPTHMNCTRLQDGVTKSALAYWKPKTEAAKVHIVKLMMGVDPDA